MTMIIRPQYMLQTIVAIAVIVFAATAAHAANKPIPAPPAGGSAEVQSLRTAYMTLYVADHDYKGHRRHAMHALEKACDLLGTDIRGDGKGHEPQTVSDDQLKQAQQIVEQVKNGLAANSPKKLVKHLEEAIKEISTALSIK
jgi:hypothetical protein